MDEHEAYHINKVKPSEAAHSQLRENYVSKGKNDNPCDWELTNYSYQPLLRWKIRSIMLFNCGKLGHAAVKSQEGKSLSLMRSSQASDKNVDKMYEPFVSRGCIARDKKKSKETD